MSTESDRAAPTLPYASPGRRTWPVRRIGAVAFALPVVAMWGRSYWRDDVWLRTSPDGDWLNVQSNYGSVDACRLSMGLAVSAGVDTAWVHDSFPAAAPAGTAHRRWAGVFAESRPVGSSPLLVVGVSYWLLTLVAGGVGWAAARWLWTAAVAIWRMVRHEADVWTAGPGGPT